MDDNFIVCIDQIIASSTRCFRPFEEVNGRVCDDGVLSLSDKGNGSGEEEQEEECSYSSSSSNKDDGDVVVEECRICQEEDQVQDMEAPCSCNGSLKFAHRKCIQRWCNKKGNTTCEICNQAFSPNYSIPPVRSNDIMAIDIRQEWERSSDFHLALASAEHQFLQTEYEDCAITQISSVACLRSATLTLVIILLIRQALMVTANTARGQDSSNIFSFQISLLQFAGIILPCCAMARSWCVMQNQRRRQG
ncbi:putative transcription factor C2H2 family [Lupinus albus]|uniref:Putative transcription factor C2H2 family n=1 Tax=Lupinus albus TaxID=3870 RepID=A0A6A4PBV3_LUPAL|nr:putative transcription factor C2H2 family [Lupinus albus]